LDYRYEKAAFGRLFCFMVSGKIMANGNALPVGVCRPWNGWGGRLLID